MPSLLHFQIIIDIAFFAVIMLLLRKLDRRIAKTRPGADGAAVGKLTKLMTESRESADLFVKDVKESEERLNKLARQLDNKEKRIIILIEKADSLLQKMASQQAGTETAGPEGGKYEKIIRMVREGESREEVAKQMGITIGEIDLVVELEQARTGH